MVLEAVSSHVIFTVETREVEEAGLKVEKNGTDNQQESKASDRGRLNNI